MSWWFLLAFERVLLARTTDPTLAPVYPDDLTSQYVLAAVPGFQVFGS